MQNKIISRDKGTIKHIIAIVLTYVFVSVAWVFFRAESIGKACDILRGLLRSDGIRFVSIYTIVFIIGFVIIHIVALVKNKRNVIRVSMNLDRFRCMVALTLLVFLIVIFMYVGDSAFIYAQF